MTLEPGPGQPSPRRRAGWRPASIVGRSLGFGAVTGAGVGCVIGLLLVAIPGLAGASGGGGTGILTILVGLVATGSLGAGFGAVIGLACGFVASIPLLIVQECASVTTRQPTRQPARGPGAPTGIRRTVAGLIGGGGAALLPAGLGFRELTRHSAGGAAFLFWLAAVAFFLGLLLGPYVVYGNPPRRRKPGR